MSRKRKKETDRSSGMKSWDYLRNIQSSSGQGPQKPWSEDLDRTASEFIDFLKNSDGKKVLKDFIVETYKKHELEKIERIKAQVKAEMKSTGHPSHPEIKASNIGALVYDDMNMADVEQAVVRSLKSTKLNLVRSVEDRLEDINRLLSNIGGFSAQLKSSFARSTVVFLEQEDPEYSFRERLVFSVNLPNYELQKPWDHSSRNGKKLSGGRFRSGKGSFQVTWDDAVNALSRIVETTGLKPKYCKNDRHYGRFVMKQELRSSDNIPDEYFSFTLDYNTLEKIDEMKIPYAKILNSYEGSIKTFANKLKGYPSDSKDLKYLRLKKKHLYLCQDRDFFIATTPDPNQLDEGLLFLIEVSTLKDYHIVKDRMQSIMTRYVLYLSKVAAQEAEHNTDVEYELSKAKGMHTSAQNTGDENQFISPDEMQDVVQYRVDGSLLKKISGSTHVPQSDPNPSESAEGINLYSRKKKAA